MCTVNSYPLVTGMIVTLLSTAFHVQANPQADKDAGAQYGRDLLNSVKGLAGSSDPATAVPGYEGSTSLPLTEYYTNQDVNGLQEDAMNEVLSGSADDPARTGYELSLQPNIPVAADDPLITGAAQTATDALANPDSLTVKTGNCALVDQTSVETTTEHCTAWLQPTTHTCSETLTVQVIGAQPCIDGVLLTAQQNGVVRSSPLTMEAMPICNSLQAGPDHFEMRIRAYATNYGGNLTHTSTTATFNIPLTSIFPALDMPGYQYTGAYFLPIRYHPPFIPGLLPRPMISMIKGGCDPASHECNYRLTYYALEAVQVVLSPIPRYTCSAGRYLMETSQYGLPYSQTTSFALLGPFFFAPSISPFPSNKAYVCVEEEFHHDITFQDPTAPQDPMITETWDDGCSFLRAQTP